jgi:TonB-linked SusC/RagA family outer membrane protein
MKSSSNLVVRSNSYLKKLLLGFKITIMIVVIGVSNVFAITASDLSKVGITNVPSGFELQQLSVSGTVTDASTAAPMPGVNVVVKGSNVGALTDISGKYSLTVPDQNAILIFSFIGYNSIEQPVSGKATIDVALSLTTKSLDEVVVIGYGTQKKSDLTGSVVRVSMEEKASLANTNLSQALSGTTAGVNVQASGLAGSEPSLSIRGQTSLSANDRPLIVLDGIIYNGSIVDINIGDVESVDILKDASAAAVYGSRSANGVMLITTKKGKSEKPVVSFNMYYGYQDMTNNPMKVMNAGQYAIRLVDYYYQQDLYTWYKTKPTSATGKPVRPDVTNPTIVAPRLRTQEERDNYLAGNEINWVDEVKQLAPIQNYNLSLSGKSGRSNYFISGSYTNEEGILLNDNFKRLTLHTNIESKVTDWFTLGLISSYSYRDYSGLEASLGDARACSPLANNKIGLPNYDMYLTGEAYMPYPLNNLYVTNSDIRNNLFIVGSGKITVPWVKGLTYEFNYSNTYSNRNNNTFWPVTVPDGSGNKGQGRKDPSEERNWIINNIVTYLRNFGDHQINATLLYSRENRKANSSRLNATGFENPVLGYNNMSLGTVATVSSNAWEENSLSYMARANYTFKNRYMVTGTFRRDGFSGFGANKKFATFPSVSLGWVASGEPFLKDLTWLYLKLRTSYGKNGNQGIGRYSSFSRMTADAYVYGSTTAIAVYPSSLGNADLGWETTSSFNIGLDFGFLNRRISGSVDVYQAKTTDVLVSRALPPTTGYPSVWTNIGAIDNKGIELELTTVNLTGRLGWETNFVFSLNRDKISKLYGDKNDKDVGNSWFVGEPISAIYDYKMAGGLWTEEELYGGNILNNWYPGQYRYVDQNGDGVIEPNADRTIIGYETPNYRFSINNTLSYKNLSFSFFINSIQGGKNYYLLNNASVVNVDFRSDNVLRINASYVRPYWTPDNGVNNSTGVYNSPAVSSGIYESRSFVRLQDISLTYRFGPGLLKTLQLEGCQFYLAAKNPYTWTKWSGWDPETGTSNSPLMRNITAGFRLTF